MGDGEMGTTAILGTRESPRRLHANGGADFGIRLPLRKAQPHKQKPARLWVRLDEFLGGKPPAPRDASASAGRRN